MEEDVENIARRIIEHFKPRRLVLFGSRAAGKMTPNSDIDLCVIEDRVADKSEEFIKIRRLLGDFIVPMDILVFEKEEFEKRKNVWGTVQYEIDKKGVVLYERRD